MTIDLGQPSLLVTLNTKQTTCLRRYQESNLLIGIGLIIALLNLENFRVQPLITHSSVLRRQKMHINPQIILMREEKSPLKEKQLIIRNTSLIKYNQLGIITITDLTMSTAQIKKRNLRVKPTTKQ